MKQRLETITKNKRHGQWTHHEIQTELIGVLAGFVKKKIVSEIKNDSSGDTVVTTLKSLSVTRWTAHESSRKRIVAELPNITKTLNYLTKGRDA